MTPELKSLLAEAHRRLHVSRYERRGGQPATEAALHAFESQFGAIPPDFRWYLSNCGSGTVGSEHVDGIDKLSETHLRFRHAREDNSWEGQDCVFVFGTDGGGGWMGIDTESGRVVVIYEDGEVATKAASFQEFLVKGLLDDGKLPAVIPETRYEPRTGSDDCEARGRKHEWYNADGRHSGCYHCATVRLGQLWKKK
ncbi:MAG: SMI1/KNR4 family protein [Planctomycetes bacterium]|nr:SMI1/KNR4 family protein [Planctomycetota bacterium]